MRSVTAIEGADAWEFVLFWGDRWFPARNRVDAALQLLQLKAEAKCRHEPHTIEACDVLIDRMIDALRLPQTVFQIARAVRIDVQLAAVLLKSLPVLSLSRGRYVLPDGEDGDADAA